MRYDEAKGLVWRLPLVRAADVGKLGPAFGLGMGCGVGVGVGIVGGFVLCFSYPLVTFSNAGPVLFLCCGRKKR
ncbi:hypothetical protein O6H91_Y276200 [Diphasiastrum complanatum]|nr:hypothetical protein O6H91_Y276200 [Diphasiastrum complanatum]